jgi:hypothetical protein
MVPAGLKERNGQPSGREGNKREEDTKENMGKNAT